MEFAIDTLSTIDKTIDTIYKFPLSDQAQAIKHDLQEMIQAAWLSAVILITVLAFLGKHTYRFVVWVFQATPIQVVITPTYTDGYDGSATVQTVPVLKIVTPNPTVEKSETVTTTGTTLEEMTIRQLRPIARTAGITGFMRMKKAELVARIRTAQNAQAA